MRIMATQNGFESVPNTSSPAMANQERRSWLKRLGAALGLTMLAGPVLAAPRGTRQTAGQDPFIGEIMLFAGNFAVQGYALCNGQLLSISQNSALFAILGTTYGGNGTTTFALPNLQGRFPMHFGNGAGLTPHSLGEVSGTESVTLNSSQMPAHLHTVGAGVTSAAGTSNLPAGKVAAATSGVVTSTGDDVAVNAYGSPANGTAASTSSGIAGNSLPHSVMNPYLALNFQIALVGIFPSRN